jgi:outer membrane biosynthesis protein TonB
MEPRRTTLSLGPLEVSFRRREDNVRLGWIGSLIAHALLIILLTTVIPHRSTTLEAELAPTATTPPVPITFVDPLPAPAPQPKPKPAEMDMHKPPPQAMAKPLRMQPVPESVAKPNRESKETEATRAGRSDSRSPGGEAGGPRPTPTPGVPDRVDEVASNPDEPKDILGRLRDFKRAVEAPPPTPHGPEGGGRGSGGVTMPNLPATGFGVGNLEFEGRDYDWENYGRQIHGIIWRAWHNRLLITASVFERWAAENRRYDLDHRNGVRFTILRSGQVVDVAIETPSGCYPLDDSATDALKEVVLPPLPADFKRDREVVHARFIADGEIRTMKAYLQQLKNAGYF